LINTNAPTPAAATPHTANGIAGEVPERLAVPFSAVTGLVSLSALAGCPMTRGESSPSSSSSKSHSLTSHLEYDSKISSADVQSSAFNKQRQFEELLSFSRRLNSY